MPGTDLRVFRHTCSRGWEELEILSQKSDPKGGHQVLTVETNYLGIFVVLCCAARTIHSIQPEKPELVGGIGMKLLSTHIPKTTIICEMEPPIEEYSRDLDFSELENHLPKPTTPYQIADQSDTVVGNMGDCHPTIFSLRLMDDSSQTPNLAHQSPVLPKQESPDSTSKTDFTQENKVITTSTVKIDNLQTPVISKKVKLGMELPEGFTLGIKGDCNSSFTRLEKPEFEISSSERHEFCVWKSQGNEKRIHVNRFHQMPLRLFVKLIHNCKNYTLKGTSKISTFFHPYAKAGCDNEIP